MNIDFSTRESVTVRPPSTALLCIDSADRNTTTYPNPYSFQIIKGQTLIPGSFTRVGVTEVVFGWSTNNIYTGNNTLIVDISGDPGAPRTIILGDNNYTAYGALQTFVAEMNDLSGTTGVHFILGTQSVPNNIPHQFFTANVEWIIECLDNNTNTPVDWEITGGTLYDQLNVFDIGTQNYQAGGMPDLRFTRYVDIVCLELTQSQNVKDTSTLTENRNLLCRFYFASDTTQYDAGGLVQYMGYLPFYNHRQWNVPKQIRFEPINNLGQVQFQVFDDQGRLLEAPDYGSINWNMTLQLSEN